MPLKPTNGTKEYLRALKEREEGIASGRQFYRQLQTSNMPIGFTWSPTQLFHSCGPIWK